MNASPNPREPFEIELAHALLPLLEILARDMDEACNHLLHQAGTDQRSVHYRAADAARGIVRAWVRLTREIRRYENTRWWLQSRNDDPRPEEPF
jgi:inhibitor of KinA sporulation pathway (predicted exonuclease)